MCGCSVYMCVSMCVSVRVCISERVYVYVCIETCNNLLKLFMEILFHQPIIHKVMIAFYFKPYYHIRCCNKKILSLCGSCISIFI